MSDYLDTTRAERLTIAKIVDPSMLDIDTASKMLYRLWDDNFGMSKQTVISAEEAEDIGNDIRAIHNLLYGAISEYNFAMGRYEELCLQNFILRRDIEHLQDALCAVSAAQIRITQHYEDIEDNAKVRANLITLSADLDGSRQAPIHRRYFAVYF